MFNKFRSFRFNAPVVFAGCMPPTSLNRDGKRDKTHVTGFRAINRITLLLPSSFYIYVSSYVRCFQPKDLLDIYISSRYKISTSTRFYFFLLKKKEKKKGSIKTTT